MKFRVDQIEPEDEQYADLVSGYYSPPDGWSVLSFAVTPSGANMAKFVYHVFLQKVTY